MSQSVMAFAFGSLCCCTLLIGGQQVMPRERRSSETVELRDAEGRVRVWLGMKEDVPTIELRDAAGSSKVEIRTSSLQLFGDDEECTAVLSSLGFAGVLRLRGPRGRYSVYLHASDGSADFAMLENELEERLSLRCDPVQRRVDINDGGGRPRIVMQVNDDDPPRSPWDDFIKEGSMLGLTWREGRAALRMTNEEGEVVYKAPQ